jgi:hypothetical protein
MNTTRRLIVTRKPVDLDMKYSSHGYAPAQVMKAESGIPCRVCGRGAGTAYICAQCAEEWEKHLGNVPSLIEDLEIAAQRRVRLSAGGQPGKRTKASEAPLPVNLTAAQRLDELTNELVGQIRVMADTYNLDMPELGDDAAAMSRWLLCQADDLRLMPDANGLVEDLDRVMHDCIRTIDAPARRNYVCQCTCKLAIWAAPGSKIVTCSCGKAYDIASTREKRLLTAHDYLVSVREAHQLSKVPINTIKSWIRRGDLVERGSRQVEVEMKYEGGVTVTRLQTVKQVRYGDVVRLKETLS